MSLVLVWLGFQKADGVVALLVAVVIFRTAIGVIRGVARTLGDEARLPADDIAATALQVHGVVDCHTCRSRGPEAHVYVDSHVVVEGDRTVDEGHAIAHRVEDALRRRFPQIADVVAHLEPSEGAAAGRPVTEDGPGRPG